MTISISSSAAGGVSLTIGELARRTGAKVTTIRWYEEVGLLPAPARSAGGHRLYDPDHLKRLELIRHAREFGFPLEAVRALLGLAENPDGPCADAHRIATEQLAAVEARLRRLEALRDELRRMVAMGCRDATAAECRVLETLAEHSHADGLDRGHPGREAAGESAP